MRDTWAKRIAWLLPRDVAYWAFIRVAAHGTTGAYGTTHPDTLSVIEAMRRWRPERSRAAARGDVSSAQPDADGDGYL